MSHSPLEYLRHILDEVNYLAIEAESLDLQQLERDERAKRAVVRSLEVIGEAAKQLSPELRNRYPEVEWRAMAAMRDKMIHHYFGVDYDIIRDVLIRKVPVLQRQISAILLSEENPKSQRDDESRF